MMAPSESAGKLKKMILKAIDDHCITRAEMEAIMAVAEEDGHIDRHEQALLDQLLEMVENRAVKIVP